MLSGAVAPLLKWPPPPRIHEVQHALRLAVAEVWSDGVLMTVLAVLMLPTAMFAWYSVPAKPGTVANPRPGGPDAQDGIVERRRRPVVARARRSAAASARSTSPWPRAATRSVSVTVSPTP